MLKLATVKTFEVMSVLSKSVLLDLPETSEYK